MPTTTIPDNIKTEARTIAKEMLGGNNAFLALSLSDQMAIYSDVVNNEMEKLAMQRGLSMPMAKGPGAEMGFEGYDPGFEGSVEAFEDLVKSVNFPNFVRDLLKGVFDANIQVMKAQTDDYIRLMKEATKGVADFVKQVKDDDTFSYLAETKGDQFNIQMEEDETGNQKLALTNPQGEPVDMEDNEVKAKIMEAKIAMAKEHRAALREVILMGVTRLVVEKGEVEAAVEFKITANRQSKTSHQNKNINVATVKGSGGFGPWSASASVSNTNININTSSKDAKDELSAKLMGKVKIVFKTDYFKLDNFAQMYGEGGVAAVKSNAPAQLPPAAPVPPAK